MKAVPLHRAYSFFISLLALMAFMGLNHSTMAQDGSPDLYNGPIIMYEEDLEDEGPVVEEEAYIYEEQYFQEESHYYEPEIKEDTSSVSMLTFNFLFYIVYKLKFSDTEDKQDASKTSDD